MRGPQHEAEASSAACARRRTVTHQLGTAVLWSLGGSMGRLQPVGPPALLIAALANFTRRNRPNFLSMDFIQCKLLSFFRSATVCLLSLLLP